MKRAIAPLVFMVVAMLGVPAAPQEKPAPAEPAPAAPEQRTVIRFLTDSDYPPFNYLDEEGTLIGFNVDVARAICLELDVTCDIQAADWTALIASLGRGDADAVVASIAATPATLAEADFSDRYYAMPARFAVHKDAERFDATPEGLEGRSIGVVKATAHEAYVRAFFRDSVLRPFDTSETARKALADKIIDALFDDGTGLVFWINGTSSSGCCELRGGPFVDERFFGDGIGIAVRKDDLALKRLLNKAIARIRASGRLEELFLRYFPIRTY